MNIAFPISILWISASVAAVESLNLGEFNFNSSFLKSFDASAKAIGAIAEDSEEGSAIPRASISRTPGLYVMTHAASGSVTLPSKTSSSSPKSSSSSPITLNAQEMDELKRILEPTATGNSSSKVPHVAEQTTAPKTDIVSVELNFVNGSSTDSMLTNASSNSTTSLPDVVLSTKAAKTYIGSIFTRSLAWLGDTYTLSIVIPILAGFLFAIVIIVTLSTFACIRRRCRRRRLRRKILPDSIRKMGPSDRARLLAETSDEEF